MPDLPLNKAAAAKAVAHFNKLRLPDVVGQPTLADAGGEWQRDIVRAVFGSIDRVSGERMVPEVFSLVPKKNNKTTGGAAIMMTALLLNERPRSEFILVGPTQEVADQAMQQCEGMIEADPEGFLQKRFHPKPHLKTIIDRRTKAFLKIKTFDMKIMVGSKPVAVLLDELHVMSTMSYASRVIGQIRGGFLPKPESFFIIITTQSDQPPAGVFKNELNHAREIRDGKIKGRMLPLLYEFPEAVQRSEKWRDPKMWAQVNPNMGRSIDLNRLIAAYDEARAKGIEEEQRWASQHLNIEIGLALGDDHWAGAPYWEAAADVTLARLEDLLERSEVCVIGIDGGGLDDLLGLAVIGRCKKTRDWLLWTHAWAQTDVLSRRKEIVPKLHDLIREESLTLCSDDDPTQDIREVADICERVLLAGKLPEKHAIGLDPQGVSATVDELALRGISGEMVVGISQGYRLSGAVWGLERKLKDGTFWHGGQEMMNWCVSNAKVERRGNAVVITKQAAGKAKIDPLIAAFDAAMLMSRNPEAKPPPNYSIHFVGG